MEAASTHRTHPLIIAAAVSVTAVSLAGIAAIFGVIPGNGGRSAVPAGEIQAAMVAPASTAAAAVAAPAATVAPIAADKPAAATLSLPAGSSVHIDTPKAHQHVQAVAKAPKSEVRPTARKVAPETASTAGYTRVANTDDGPAVYAERAPRPVPGVAPPAPDQAAPVAPPCHDCGTIAGIRETKKEGDANGIGAVAGGLLGGVAGRQIGSGHGRDAMTVIGAIGGAYAGHRIEKSQRTTNAYEVTVRFDDGSTKIVTQDSVPNWRQGERVRVSGGQISPL